MKAFFGGLHPLRPVVYWPAHGKSTLTGELPLPPRAGDEDVHRDLTAAADGDVRAGAGVGARGTDGGGLRRDAD